MAPNVAPRKCAACGTVKSVRWRRGRCYRCYRATLGTSVLPARPSSHDERFWRNVDRSAGLDGCWPWTGGRLTTEGWGRFRHDGRTTLAHRFAYAEWHGPIPAGLQVRQTCDDRLCCNPRHLRLIPRY